MATGKKAWIAPKVTTLRLTPEIAALFPGAKIAQPERGNSVRSRPIARLEDGRLAR